MLKYLVVLIIPLLCMCRFSILNTLLLFVCFIFTYSSFFNAVSRPPSYRKTLTNHNVLKKEIGLKFIIRIKMGVVGGKLTIYFGLSTG